MAYPRTKRIGEEIRKIISSLIKNELKDPRISPLTSIIEVDVTKDLRYANIFVSVYGTDEDQTNTIIALTSAAGFIRKVIGKELKLRYTPEPLFKIDRSIEKGLYISNLLKNNSQPSKQNDEDKNDGNNE